MLRRITWSFLSSPRNTIATQHLNKPKSKFKDFCALLDRVPAITVVSKHVFQRPDDWADHWQVTGYLFDDDPDWEAPQELLDFLSAGEAPVYIGFGSMPDSKPEATTNLIIEAVQRSGQRAVILKGWAGLGAEQVPDNIYVLDYAPHNWLFSRMAAVIHHGGAGTTASGLRAGLPTTIVPHLADQPYWGRTVKALGVGTEPIPRKKLTVDNLCQAIQTITSDQAMRQKARALGKKIEQEDGLAEAVKWVEHFMTTFV